MPPTIVFLSDYGADEYVGICHGVIARVAPDARVLDLAHQIPAQDVLRGALVLGQAVPFMPLDADYLAIVDPGVGRGDRRAVAVEAANGSRLVGPDNGLLSMAWRALGGAARAVEISSDEVILKPLSATFHGRDVFAPATGFLAAGRPLEFLGPEIDPASLVLLDLPEPRVGDGRVECVVQAVDRYGNLQLNVSREHLEAAGLTGLDVIDVHAADWTIPVRTVKTFADLPVGNLGLLVDSTGAVALFLNQGSAADAFAVESGDEVILGRPGEVE